jgi:hypothetical protein
MDPLEGENADAFSTVDGASVQRRSQSQPLAFEGIKSHLILAYASAVPRDLNRMDYFRVVCPIVAGVRQHRAEQLGCLDVCRRHARGSLSAARGE